MHRGHVDRRRHVRDQAQPDRRARGRPPGPPGQAGPAPPWSCARGPRPAGALRLATLRRAPPLSADLRALPGARPSSPPAPPPLPGPGAGACWGLLAAAGGPCPVGHGGERLGARRRLLPGPLRARRAGRRRPAHPADPGRRLPGRPVVAGGGGRGPGVAAGHGPGGGAGGRGPPDGAGGHPADRRLHGRQPRRLRLARRGGRRHRRLQPPPAPPDRPVRPVQEPAPAGRRALGVALGPRLRPGHGGRGRDAPRWSTSTGSPPRSRR